MQQFRGADAVDDAQSGALEPGVPGGRGQVLARRHAPPQRGDVVPVQLVEHRAVGGRGGEQHGDAVFGDRGQQLPGARLLEQQGARPGPQREDDEPAEPEGEAERGTAREDVVGVRPQYVPREGVRDGEHIAVEVHTALRTARGARGEGDQRHVVGRRVHGCERLLGGGKAQQVVGGAAAVGGDVQPGDAGVHQVVERARVAQGVPDPGDLAHRAQFVRTLLGEHGDGDRTRLEHRQPAGGQPRGGGAAQQDAVAGDHAEPGGEHMRDPVHAGAELAVRPHPAVRRAEGGALGCGAGEQFRGGVESFGVVQLRQVEAEFGPLVPRRQVVAGEGVAVGGAGGARTGQGALPVGTGPGGRGARGVPVVQGGSPLVVVGSRIERIVLVTTVNGPRYGRVGQPARPGTPSGRGDRQ